MFWIGMLMKRSLGCEKACSLQLLMTSRRTAKSFPLLQNCGYFLKLWKFCESTSTILQSRLIASHLFSSSIILSFLHLLSMCF